MEAARTELPVNGPNIDEDTTCRDHLRIKRDRLFKQFLKSPSETQLAIEIRLIDDQIAELVELITKNVPTQTKRQQGGSAGRG